MISRELFIMDKNKVTKWLSKLNTNSYNKKYVLTAILEDCNYEELELIYQRYNAP